MSQIPESVRRRLQAQQPGEHPDADLLTAFSEHTLGGAERNRVLAHLGGCASCREVVALALPQEDPSRPALAPEGGGWFRWSLVRWIAAGAAAVVVAAAVITQIPLRQPAEPEVAPPPSLSADKPAAIEEKETKTTPGVSNEVATPTKKAKPVEKAERPATPSVNERTLDGKPGGVPPVVEQPVPVAKQNAPVMQAENTVAHRNPPEERADAKDKDVVNAKPSLADAAITKPEAVFGVAGGAAPASRRRVAAATASAPAAAKTAAEAAPPPPPPPQAVQEMRKSDSAAKMVMRNAANLPIAPPRWRISSTGKVESTRDGKTWEAIEIDPAVTFRAISANGTDVWAGGTAGALFHTTDGRAWQRVKVGTEGMWVYEAIVSVDFFAPGQGIVTTEHHAQWVTADGGRTWERR